MIIILLGPPGVGKGSQANKIIEEYGLTHISTGDIFRKNIKEETELGLKVKEIIASGALVSDELTDELVFDRLKEDDAKKGFMLDGYPRNINQATALNKWLENNNEKLTRVIYLYSDEETLIERISGRRVCKSCGATYHVNNKPTKVEGVCDNCGGEVIQRPDDKVETAKQRIEIYDQQTSPLVEFYAKSGDLVKIDATRDVNDVFVDVKNSLK